MENEYIKEIWRNLKRHASHIKNQVVHDSSSNKNHHDLYKIKTRLLSVSFEHHLINNDILTCLINLARAAALKNRIEDLFQGVTVNYSENKPALHTALRGSYINPITGEQAARDKLIMSMFTKMELISSNIRSQSWLGYTGKPIKHIVNIGIGGSYLGPKLLKESLSPFMMPTINLEFISNIDPWDIEDTLRHTNIEETLFIVSSKSFETEETLANLGIAKNLYPKHSHIFNKHFIAITANEKKATDYGFEKSNILPLWDWIGGRYSIWSAISLPIIIAIGMNNFKEFLRGAHEMDVHFLKKPFHQNIPVLLGLIDIWNINFFNAETLAIIPYAKKLKFLVPYLAQLFMESLGKNHDIQGKELHYKSGAIIWGDIGTNSQHSSHQLLMQGTHFIPCDFILPLKTHAKNKMLHEALKINCHAQMETLKRGRHDDNPNHEIMGNKPFTLIELSKITPFSLGKLLALYEHRVFTQAAIWNINPFDQFGVEQGKIIAKELNKNKIKSN